MAVPLGGGVDHGGACCIECCHHIAHYIVPAGGAHNGRLEMLRNPFVVGTEGCGGGKVDADALACYFGRGGAHIFGGAHKFDSFMEQYSFYDMAHTAIAADNYLHIVFYCSMLRIIPLAASRAPSPEPLITRG